nr:hypothetical protein [Tanacetum cinerariifolium]
EDDRVVRATTTATSLEAEQESGSGPRCQDTTLGDADAQTRFDSASKQSHDPPLSKINTSRSGEDSMEYQDGSGPRCQDTTLGDADAQTRFDSASKQSHDPPLSKINTSRSGEDSMEYQDGLTDFVPPTPHDSPLSGDHTPRSDEGRPNVHELMVIYTQLSNRVLTLEQSKTAQDLVIKKLQKKV